MAAELPEELRALVRRSVALHGEIVRKELGQAAYRRIERIRIRMADLRDSSHDRAYRELKQTLASLDRLSRSDQQEVAHAFSLMLELMNACENAYRTHRLRTLAREGGEKPAPQHGTQTVIYVLTAHPTESRAPANIRVFELIQQSLVDALDGTFESQEATLRHLLEIAWRVATSRWKKPEVQDEADHIYSILLRDETLLALVAASRDIVPVYIRSWVGGDKDGHPGVDEKVMIDSLERSRARLLRFVARRLEETRGTLNLITVKSGGEAGATDAGAASLMAEAIRLIRKLPSLERISTNDASRVHAFRRELRAWTRAYREEIGELHPSLAVLERLTQLFPALVVPLELRDSSDVMLEAARGRRVAIFRMVATLKRISGREDPRWYARGLIISMTHEFAHVEAACDTLEKALGGLRIPVIPLFEDRTALSRASRIVEKMIRSPRITRARKAHWDGFMEIMLGYSDSAKEMGVLASRLGIGDAILELNRIFEKNRVTPIFFHGSGGSVDRGGGSLSEQTARWPQSAICRYKATIQGEMVERTFASPEITRGGIERIAERAHQALTSGTKRSREAGTPPVVREFARRVSADYQNRIQSPEFLEVVKKATAYMYLEELKIGSRPTKRQTGDLAVSKLRAIPWVLSWTQTRVLFPTWWGVGRAWSEASAKERASLKRAFRSDPLFRSYVKVLGFTLAKVEMPIWRHYLEASSLPPARSKAVYREFLDEFERACRFVRALSGSEDLLWFRPWLGLSIRLRSSMIHPLNLLQILALRRKGGDPRMIRETVTGIASGMLTTG